MAQQSFTPKQGQYLAFIKAYTARHDVAPSHSDFQRHFGTTAPSVNDMIKRLKSKGLISHTPGEARSVELTVDPAILPKLNGRLKASAPPQTGWVWMPPEELPDSGGTAIGEREKIEVERRIQQYAKENYAGCYNRIELRFQKQFCYIDAFVEPCEPSEEMLKLRNETHDEYMKTMRNIPTHLVRMRYFSMERWSAAFYKYSDEKYELCILESGSFIGTPEECFQVGAIYLT